jgi:hypothetical protein
MSDSNFKIGGIGEEQVEIPAIPEVSETPAAEVPAVETPVVEAPVAEAPVVETPEAPVVETPVVETPVVEVPVTVPTIEAPTAEKPTPATVKFDDPEMQDFYDFKQNNKEAGLKEFIDSKKDWSTVDDLTLLQNKIQRENPNVELSESQLNSLIEKEFEIDLAEGFSELEDADKLTLKLAGGQERTQLKEIQQKYNTPKETPTPEVAPEPSHAVSDTVTLSNGQVMNKTEYESARTKYKADVQTAVNSLEKQTYNFDVGSGDEKKTLSFDYIVEQDDRQSLLSELDNVPMATIQQHIDGSGNLDVAGLSKSQLMRNEARSQKMIGRLLSLAYAQGQEEVLKQETNVNFDTSKPPLPPQKNKPIIANRDDVVTVNMHGF